MPATPRVDPEVITLIAQHTIAKLSERAVGRMTYQIAVGASGTVYVSVNANEGGGCFSQEWIAMPHLRSVLAPHLDSGKSFPTSVLRAAFVSRSTNNAGFLAALLRHAGLLQAGIPPHAHVASASWDDWEAEQRRRLEVGERLEPAETETRRQRDARAARSRRPHNA